MSAGDQGKSDTTQSYVPFRVDTSKPLPEGERIPLFYIDDREFTGPAHVSAGTALRAIRNAAQHGVVYAAYHCLIEAIGEDAYQALIDCPHVTFEQAQSLSTKISDMYFGQAMEVAGK